jgi:hypothetical protein
MSPIPTLPQHHRHRDTDLRATQTRPLQITITQTTDSNNKVSRLKMRTLFGDLPPCLRQANPQIGMVHHHVYQ